MLSLHRKTKQTFEDGKQIVNVPQFQNGFLCSLTKFVWIVEDHELRFLTVCYLVRSSFVGTFLSEYFKEIVGVKILFPK